MGGILSGGLASSGYRYVSLSKAGDKKQFYVHHLVAAEFIGPRPDGMVIMHLDDDTLNNNVDNLKYGTQAENIRHSFRDGRRGVLAKDTPCQEDGCEDFVESRGCCRRHYVRHQYRGTGPFADNPPCTVNGCDTPAGHIRRRLCGFHYQKASKRTDFVSFISDDVCAKGHPRAEYQRVTPMGDKYCSRCQSAWNKKWITEARKKVQARINAS
ncbi:HNH endonuclease [Mycolicibacterium smegmatis]|nr:HNH endonuclease [Mycolicibacterium smegmatis]